MALTNTELDAYVNKYIVPKSTDTIFKNSPVLTRLSTRNREKFTGGLYIQRPIIIGELNGGAAGRGETFNIDFVTTDAAFTDELKLYWVAIALYGYDSLKNDGEFSVFSQVEMKFTNASLTMAKLLATDLYKDNLAARSKCMTGLPMWYDNGVLYPAVGGVTRSDIVAPPTVGGLNAYTNTLTTFRLKDVNTAYGASWFGADHVDMVVATQNGYDLIWEALQPMQRYGNQNASSDLGQAGFEAFRFNAADVVVDKYMPTGTSGVMYGINTKYIEWYFSNNKKFEYGWTGFKEANNSIDVAGQFLTAHSLINANPRSGFKLLSTLF
jgi:hypothetical protein